VFGNKGRETADALLALLGTKIVHSSNDAVTNQWAADLIGKIWQGRKRLGDNRDTSGNRSLHAHTDEIFEYQEGATPHDFSVLRTYPNPEAIVAVNGKIFNASGASFLKTSFVQPDMPENFDNSK